MHEGRRRSFAHTAGEGEQGGVQGHALVEGRAGEGLRAAHSEVPMA
jgi:hypothetical protein